MHYTEGNPITPRVTYSSRQRVLKADGGSESANDPLEEKRLKPHFTSFTAVCPTWIRNGKSAVGLTSPENRTIRTFSGKEPRRTAITRRFDDKWVESGILRRTIPMWAFVLLRIWRNKHSGCSPRSRYSQGRRNRYRAFNKVCSRQAYRSHGVRSRPVGVQGRQDWTSFDSRVDTANPACIITGVDCSS